MRARAPRLMIAGTSSNVGKTTVTCGLMRALTLRGMRVQACKCGPDYIDPVFHERVLGIPSRNLDLFLAGDKLVRRLVAEGARKADLTLMEGAMGYYDGIAQSTHASAYEVAQVTGTPVVLVVDARGKALSCAAEVAGFVRFREPSLVAGVMLNRVSAGYFPMLRQVIERETGVPVLGYLPRMDEARLQSRHLGLVGADEVVDLQQRIDALAQTLAKTVDVDALVRIAQSAPELEFEPWGETVPRKDGPLIAIADDAAFTFCYADTLATLERLGARLVRFSPLKDESLPRGICGLYLCGGYPELHARALSANSSMRSSIREAVEAGLPTIAECGGFLYLQETLEDAEGTPWPMVGALLGHGYRTGRLGRFGYVTLAARANSLLADEGETLRAHEFHYWDSDHCGNAFRAQKPQSSRGWGCVVATSSLYAGFPHLYLAGDLRAATRFVEACARFGAARGEE